MKREDAIRSKTPYERKLIERYGYLPTGIKNVQNVLDLFRSLCGLNQGEVAEAIGCSSSAISQWDKGETKPKEERVIALIELLAKKLFEKDGCSEADAARSAARLLESNLEHDKVVGCDWDFANANERLAHLISEYARFLASQEETRALVTILDSLEGQLARYNYLHSMDELIGERQILFEKAGLHDYFML